MCNYCQFFPFFLLFIRICNYRYFNFFICLIIIPVERWIKPWPKVWPNLTSSVKTPDNPVLLTAYLWDLKLAEMSVYICLLITMISSISNTGLATIGFMFLKTPSLGCSTRRQAHSAALWGLLESWLRLFIKKAEFNQDPVSSNRPQAIKSLLVLRWLLRIVFCLLFVHHSVVSSLLEDIQLWVEVDLISSGVVHKPTQL